MTINRNSYLNADSFTSYGVTVFIPLTTSSLVAHHVRSSSTLYLDLMTCAKHVDTLKAQIHCMKLGDDACVEMCQVIEW